MGELITKVKPYFLWVSRYHREPNPSLKLRLLRNELATLNATETNEPIKQRLGRIVNPSPAA